MNKFFRIFLCLFAGLSANTSHADWYFEFGGGKDSGDEIDIRVYEEGGDSETESVSLGGGIYFAFGGFQQLTNNWGLQYTFGYKVDDVTATEQQVKFSRYPVNLLAVYQLGESIQIAGGVTREFSPDLNLNDVGGENLAAEDATGAVAQIGYLAGPSGGIFLRHTRIEYDFGGPEMGRGNNTSLHIAFWW
ncbi:MAG TPA: hypothetical protein VFV64_07965 [Permianibacter sp.]|nr:hypothetical protein [Permianibacter sp.]